MDKLISEQAAIDAVSDACFELRGVFGRCKDALKALPSAQPQYDEEWRKKHYETSYNQGYVDGYKMCEKRLPRWIPCSERLPEHPENDDYYLVTIQCEHYDGWDDYVTGFAEWTKYGWDTISCYIGQIKVIAWMPLPEPYTERREG